MKRKALVLGGLGVIGRTLVTHLEDDAGWDVVAVSRRKPGFETRARFVAVDLLDRSDTEARLSELEDVTHIFYAAYQARPTRREEVVPNLTMIRNAVEVIETASPRLEHVNLIQGGKAYGCHLGPFKTPGKETDPRHLPPNFYYDQEDFLRSQQQGKRWTWSALRPEAVCGFAVGNPMNLPMVIAVYGSICRELGIPLAFPGKPGAYTALYQVTDARILAKAMVWAATTPACGNEIFNITNGDYFRWQNVWPSFAHFFGLELAEPRTISLVEFMADKAPLWDSMVERYELLPNRYEEIVSWGFGDAIFGSDWDNITTTLKARKYGFDEFIDSEEMFLELFADLQAHHLIPQTQVPSVGPRAGIEAS